MIINEDKQIQSAEAMLGLMLKVQILEKQNADILKAAEEVVDFIYGMTKDCCVTGLCNECKERSVVLDNLEKAIRNTKEK